MKTYRHLVCLVALCLVVVPTLMSPGASAQSDGTTYQSPTYGYTLEWGSDWQVGDEFSESGFDLLRLDRELSTLWFEGQEGFGGDPATCLEESAAEFENTPGVENFESREDDGAAEEERAFGLYTYDFTDDAGETVAYTTYIDCRTLIPDQAVLEITHLTPADAYEEESEGVAEILEALEIPDEVIAAPGGDGERPATREQFVSSMQSAEADIDDFWQLIFEESGLEYESPTVVYFDDTVETACGIYAPMEVGPFQCSADASIYIDVPMMEELILPHGQFAVAFVLAHEWGHHIQYLLEIEKCPLNRCLAGTTSVELELMADCLAGAWTQYADMMGTVRYGDTEAALVVLATLVGDPEGTRVDDPAVHGPGTLRAWWFLKGYYEGVETCLAAA